MKKKKTLILFAIIAVIVSILVYRMLSCYTLVSLPFTTREVYETGTKYDFPFVLINPIRCKSIKDSISNYIMLEMQKDVVEDWKYNLYNILLSGSIKIISINSVDGNLLILITTKQKPEIRAVFVYNLKIKKISTAIL